METRRRTTGTPILRALQTEALSKSQDTDWKRAADGEIPASVCADVPNHGMNFPPEESMSAASVHRLKPDRTAFMACEDNLEFMGRLPNGSMQLIVSSPPYNIGKKYEKRSSLESYVRAQAAVVAECEGVSLHRICHHAIYLDRTFNAAHYLQSEDRIHRFGLPPNQETTVEIVECIGSVDETVRGRLGYKISKMAEALEDSSLHPDPIPLDPSDIEDIDDYSTGLSQEDIRALIHDLAGKPT